MNEWRSPHGMSDSEIAIIGMSCRFPGAKDSDAFWQNLQDGVESIFRFSDQELMASGIDPALLKNPNYVKAGAVLSDIEWFDASFFGISPREAEIMDPQHRLFLECAWEAIENAGYDPETDEGAIGVYAGVGINTYLLNNLYPNRDRLESVSDFQVMIANEKDFLPTRVSYKLNLKGPAVTVQTACSTSLVAVHLACQSLLNGECDLALAGGVSVHVPQKAGYLYQEGMIFSPDGHCRAFDAKAKGTVGGNGVGIVVLKRLGDAIADGDSIHAIIKGSAINNDGSAKVGYTAPSVSGQAAVISEAMAVAGVEPETLTYIEAHGTGTALGDPIEIAALTQAFRARTRAEDAHKGPGYCAIGSVKTNVGHLDAAAGVAGLIKTVLALKHQMIPPSLHFEPPNPKIDFQNSPFYVNTTLRPWLTDGPPRRAGSSSFGIGGTNAHVVLEEAPPREVSGESRPWQLLVISAKTSTALDTATANLVEHLKKHPDLNLADVAYTTQVGRKGWKHRRMVVCRDLDDAVTALGTLDPKRVLTDFQEPRERPVAFMFPGQGAQYVNMGLELYQVEPTFRQQIDRCSELLKPHLGLDLRDVLYPSEEQTEEAAQQLQQTSLTQPALFVLEYALANLWLEWGVRPAAMIGHSIGEYVAACLAGVFSLEDALALVAARGQMIQQLPFGAMLAVPLEELEVHPLLGVKLSLAAINGPSLCVVSGPTDAVDALQNQLAEQGVACRHLHTSHAFHSEMMDPILGPFTGQVKKVRLNPPQIPYVSNVTGTWMTAADATDASYWARHLRQTVRFAEGMGQLLKEPERILLEVGPGRTLSTFARRQKDKGVEPIVLASLRHPLVKDSRNGDRQSDVAFLLTTLGRLWLAGVPVDWSGFYAHERRHRLPLPTYPFERQRYWVEPPSLMRWPSPMRGIEPPGIDQQIQLEALQEKEPPQKVDSTLLYSRPSLQNAYVAPCNALERTIADIWQKCLGIEPVGMHDDFFELGGDSLLAVQVISRLRDALGVELPPSHIVEAPTVAMLAQVVEETRTSRKQTASLLVEIQRGGSKPPLFCIHPAGGTVFCYVHLARYLGSEQPVYGVQAPSLYGGEAYSNLEDRAAHYIEAIRGVQSEGPYRLGGLSYGGNMAVEMAIKLQRQGHEVALLALFDSYPPISYENQVEDDTRFLAAFLAMADLYWGNKPRISYDELRQIGLEEQWDYVLKRMEDVVFPDMEIQEAPRFFQIWKSHHRELWNSAPKQIYPGRITLFRAIEKLPGDLEQLLNLNLRDSAIIEGWSQLSSEPIAIYDVPGNHYTMLREPYVQILAKQLVACLHEA